MMKHLKFLIGFILLVLTALASFGTFSLPRVEKGDSDRFSAERASKHIEVMSKVPHSVEHPVERAQVRRYLYDILEDMGGEPEIHEYDSIKF